MIKFTILLRRHPAMTQEQSVQYHREQHAPLFTSLAEVKQYVRRYVQSHSTGEQLPGIPPMTFDGVTELWFDEMAGLTGVFGSQGYLDRIRPDEARFLSLDRCEFALTKEHVVIG